MIENLFLCVGAQKTGTTWLHAQLKDHPEIGFSHVKEVHYFNTMHNGSILLTTRKVEHIKRLIENNRFALEKYFSDLSAGKNVDAGIQRLLSPVDDNWYIKLFDNSKKYSADFTPEYALLPQKGIDNIKKVSKNQKLIFIMRDPIKRAKSAIQYYFQMSNIDINDVSDSDILKVAKKSFILNMSKYENTISLLDSNFNSEDICYMFFEDIMEDKQKSINKVTKFLGVTDLINSKNSLEKKVNTSKKYQFSKEVNDFLSDNLIDTYKFIYCKYENLPNGWSAKG